MRDDWEIRELGDICEYQNGFAFKSKTYRDSGAPVIRISDIQNGRIDTSSIVHVNQNDYDRNLSRYEIKKGDLLIAMSGATTGKIGLVETDETFLLNQRVGKFKPGEDLDKKYLFYYLLEKVEEVLKMSAGSAQPNLSTGQIKAFQIPVPSLDEQKRIVYILDEAFEIIDQARTNIERNIENAEELFQSKLVTVFADKNNKWKTVKLRSICQYDKTTNEEEGLPYVGLGDIGSDTGKFIGDLHPKEMKSRTFHFRDTHLLYGRLRPYLNKVLLPTFEGHCSTEIFPIKTSDQITRSFLFYWFLNPRIVNKIDATSTGARMPRANMKKVLDFNINLPGIEEQKKIVEHLKGIKEMSHLLITNYETSTIKLSNLKKSILQQAFSGALTGPESGFTGWEDEQDELGNRAAESVQTYGME